MWRHPKNNTLKTLDDHCKIKFECEEGLYCYGGKFTIHDSVSGCSVNEEVHKTKSGWECKLTSIDYYTYKDDVTIISLTPYSTDYLKVCGEITFKPVSLGTGQGTQYDIMSIKYDYFGKIPDGRFV